MSDSVKGYIAILVIAMVFLAFWVFKYFKYKKQRIPVPLTMDLHTYNPTTGIWAVQTIFSSDSGKTWSLVAVIGEKKHFRDVKDVYPMITNEAINMIARLPERMGVPLTELEKAQLMMLGIKVLETPGRASIQVHKQQLD